MNRSASRRRKPLLLAVGCWCLMTVVLVASAAGLTPKSPEVQQAVANAVGFLESEAGNDNRMGAKALVGLAVLKSGAKKNHPRIREAVAAIMNVVNSTSNAGSLPFNKIYTPGIATIFLVELDHVVYAGEIRKLLDFFDHVQRPSGAWGYASHPEFSKTGDTSMTQYAVLCMWEAARAGIEVPRQNVEEVLLWLLKTQGPSGGYGYQGVIAQSSRPVAQTGVTPSLSAAGLSSVYACADLLGFADKDSKLPSALVRVERRRPGGSTLIVELHRVEEAQSRGKRWMQQNYTTESGRWTHYYLYAWERYHSFREAAEGTSHPEPKWYNDGAQFLLETQDPDGSWAVEHPDGGKPVSTAFSVLFLVRSMKKSIERARSFGSGTLVGGRGLPKDSDAVVVRDGKVISLPEVEAVEAVLSAVDQSDAPDRLQTIEALTHMSSEDATPLIDKHAEKLRQLAGGASPDARLAAVRALAKRRSMEDVPVLIYALTDPDSTVILAARDGLRRISRRFDGFGLPDQFTDAERRAAVERWKQWYLSVRPNAELVE